jgi:phosphohistidine swiveling domain-containing protein
VLGKSAQGLDFTQTATLHYSHAYFNASLLGQIFRRMGLPPESLEFLTRGVPMSKPSLGTTLRSIPGLCKLGLRELRLARDFERDSRLIFVPTLRGLSSRSPTQLSPSELRNRIHQILKVLRRATYYSILAPLSAALRQTLLKVKDEELDTSQTPETASLRSLQAIARASRHLLSPLEPLPRGSTSLFAALAASPDGTTVLSQLDRFLDRYGYLSEVGTDIAVPTWKEDPRPVRELFASLLLNPESERSQPLPKQSLKARLAQQRVNLKGEVAAIYSQLLAELRWSFIALEQAWLEAGLLADSGDIFFLEFAEIRQIIENTSPQLVGQLSRLIAERRLRFEQDVQLEAVPAVVYGKAVPALNLNLGTWTPSQRLQGIGASPGRVEGTIKVLRNLQTIPEIDRTTILVVPYTDAGWAPLLSRAGGLISEVGGRLSHGAIIAREYQIPAVMEIPNATQRLQDGQQVRIDGQQGTIEIL